MKRKWQKNINLDAALVHAGAHGGFEGFAHCAMQLGFDSPDEAVDRANWLKRQSDKYIQQVSERVVEMEKSK